MLDFIGDVGGTITDYLGDAVSSVLSDILYATIYKLLYYLGWALCKVVHYMESLFEVFSGTTTVKYDGANSFLINVFFHNQAISGVYWGMAILGMIFAIVFALIAVIRRIFDLRDKDQRSMGQIIGSLAKTMILIISMNLIMIMVINMTNLLMQQIGFLFTNANLIGKEMEHYFTEEEYAAMGRCLNTLGNYSLNPSYESRLNINACYNEMRPDLDFLQRQGIFEFYYETKESAAEDAKTIETWQSLLQKIANARDTSRDMKLDVYDESLYNAVKDAMDELSRNNNLRPLYHIERKMSKKTQSTHVPLDRYLFLTATFEAAKTDTYNKNPDFEDAVRGPYYWGKKDMYNLDQVSEDFDIGVHKMNYLVWYIMGVALIWDLAVIIFSCVSRIFNMILLYLISPLIFAVEPLDDGAKRKQWTVAFVVQTFGVFATVVAMRLSLLFIPVIVGSKLVLFENSSVMNLIGKIILILGLFEVVKKANGVVTGILADSAGWQNIQASDWAMGRGEQAAGKAVAGLVLPATAAWGVTKFAGGLIGSGVKKAWNARKSDDSSSGGGDGGGGGNDLPEKQK